MTTQEFEVVTHTVDAFMTFIDQPENAEKLFEYIAGEIVEVPSNPYVSAIAYNIGFLIKLFLREHKEIQGYVTGEAGGYEISGEYYAPDVAFISKTKQPELPKEGYNPNTPDLAVEVISSKRSDEQARLRIKVTNYLSVGTVVWVVRPEEKTIEVHTPGQAVKVYRKTGEISGGDMLPGFKLDIKEVFEQTS